MAEEAPSAPSKPASAEEVDYMNMTIHEPTHPPQKETYTQRRIRKKREAEEKQYSPINPPGRPSIATALSNTSKGFKMLAKLGYTPGSALGAPGNKNAMLEPIGVELKEDRSGIGLLNEKKRKFREEVEVKERAEKAEEVGFRERVAREREHKRIEGLLASAMRVLEGLEENADEAQEPRRKKKKVNVLYRGLVRQRQEDERERRARYDLHQSLSRNAAYEKEDDDDRLALGTEEEDVEEADDELHAFESLEPEERVQRLIDELREKWWYCFWCKCRYENEAMDGCPGKSEDDHD
ncbi:hypothetical protein MMC31_000589 [Peltigera leucophlebia]|nr:hypothetical protein [Peltigera leucophlebia]